MKAAGWGNNDGEYNAIAMLVNVNLNKADKSALRTNVRYYTNMGLQAADYTGDAADFIAFQNELSASAVRLGTVTGSDTSDTLAAKYAALTKNTYVATVNHKLPVTTGGTGNVNGTPIADDADGTADGYITITETKNFSSGDTVDFAPNNYAEYVIASANGYTPNTSAQTVLNRRSAITQNYIYIKTECTVTFNANGGTVNPTTSDVALGAVYGSGTGGWPTPIKSGYTFEGWFTGVGGTGTKITMFTTLTTAVDQTLYAKWSPHTYTIAYDPGVSSGIGGSPMDVSEATYDVPITLRVNTFTRTGYNFIGWATSNGGQLQYIDGDAVSNLTAVNEGSVTLYATWTGNVYTVHYNGNGETGGSTTNSNHVYGTPKNLTANGFTKTGYTFAGWATSAGGPKVYDNAHTVTNLMTLPGAFDLYAVWTANTYTIAYNPNGGEGATMTPSAHTYDGWEPLTANGYTRTGYTFLGWSKDQEATTPTYTDGAYVTNVPPATGNITFFAVWSINRYTVTFNANGGTGEVPLTVNQDYATPVALPATAGNILWPVTIGTTAVKFSRGWNTTMNADEKLSSYAVPASNSTLYTVWGADYTGVLNASNLANADYLPATNDTRYLPGGDLYQLGGFTHTGIYPRSDFTWASIANLNNAVQAIDFTRKQSEQDTLVDGYETAIMAAYGNIVLAPADYSTLNGLIYDATDGLNRALYTTDSLVAVDDERANGEAMVANAFKKPLQYRVDQRCVALENALNSLVFKEADYSVVRDIWNTGPDFTKYTDDSVYDVVYFYEQEINWDLLIDNQYIVDDYAQTLRDLMDALVLKAADYTGVIAALVAIPDGDGNEYFDKQALEEIYNTSSVANLEDKVNAVDWDKDITEQLAVDGYAQAIVAATSALIPRAANYTFLGVALNKPLLLPVSYYTEASYQFYQSKMTNGWNRYNNQNLTILQQGIIDQATQAIYDAYDLLTPKTVNYTVKYQTTDETPLQLAIDAVKTGPAGSQVTETALDITGYTPVETPIQKILTGTDFETVIIFTYVINEYTVTFDANGGTDVDAITQNYNTTVAQPDDPTRTGYVFAGWYLDEALTTAVTWPYTLGGSNVTFYANWTANTYTIIYDGSGATSGSTASSLQTYDAASNLTSNGFTKTGNSFVGWATTPGGTAEYSDGQSVTNLTPTLNDVITFYAVWAINEYTISFNSDGGSPLADITQDYDTSVTAPADPTKEGYTFNGWLPAVPATMPAEDTECVAQWTINEYTVSFDSDGGSAVDSITQDYATEITAPADPTKTGYTFIGWSPAVPATMPAEDTECVAQWTLNTYTITFDADGGTGGEAQTVEHGTTPVAPEVSREGHTFIDWAPAIAAATADATYT
ncbi:MAG: InlB B-repeat-containing protein, partial [Clostridiales bacterium]|nr:InlB B-repeat-containing protein [Clostridiales bacterium]